MAWNLSRICYKTQHFLSLYTFARNLPQFYSKFEVDVIDNFTSQLMEKKISKWDLQRRKNEALIENSTNIKDDKTEDINVKNLTVEEVEFLFQDAIDKGDIKSTTHLAKLCVEDNKSPSFSILINIVSICSQSGERDLICQLETLCEKYFPELLKENSNFEHFLAEAIWIRGDIPKAVQIFEKVYRENAYLRRRIRLMLKYLIVDVVSNTSEGALRNIINFSERVLKDFQDFYPLALVWQSCFLSEWFTDQCIALELLDRNNGLCKSVVNRIPYVVFVSLKCHRTEVVYRLLEILLKYKMKHQYSDVLTALLDFQFKNGDLLSCAEIITWAFENDVALPKNEPIKLINLLVNAKMKTSLVPLRAKIEHKPKYNLKF